MAADPHAGESPPVPAPDKLGTVTVAGKLGDDLARGTWNSIKRQAGLKE